MVVVDGDGGGGDGGGRGLVRVRLRVGPRVSDWSESEWESE